MVEWAADIPLPGTTAVVHPVAPAGFFKLLLEGDPDHLGAWPGNHRLCLDNAVAESWFASLKVDLVAQAHYRTRAEGRTAIFACITWYNRVGALTNGYMSPVEWERHAVINPLPLATAA